MLRRVRKYLWPWQPQSNGISGRKLSQIARQIVVAIGNVLAWQRQPLHTRRHLEVPPQPVLKTRLARFVNYVTLACNQSPMRLDGNWLIDQTSDGAILQSVTPDWHA